MGWQPKQPEYIMIEQLGIIIGQLNELIALMKKPTAAPSNGDDQTQQSESHP